MNESNAGGRPNKILGGSNLGIIPAIGIWSNVASTNLSPSAVPILILTGFLTVLWRDLVFAYTRIGSNIS